MKTILSLLLCIWVCSSAIAQYSDNIWNAQDATDKTDWNKKDNWLLDSVPTPCHKVIVPTIAATPQINPKLTSDIYLSNLNFSGLGSLDLANQDIDFITGGASLPNVYTNIRETPPPSTPRIFNYVYAVQRKPDEAVSSNEYALRRAVNKCAPTYRFEVRPGDNWSGDLNPAGTPISSGNDQNGRIRERSELRQDNANTPWNTDVWTSWSMYIEGDPSIPTSESTPSNALNEYGAVDYGSDSTTNSFKDYLCAVGQWHGSPDGGAPHWSLDFRTVNGVDRLTLKTIGGVASTSNTRATVRKIFFNITRNTWHNITLRVKHNSSPTNPSGSITWYIDGRKLYEEFGIPIGYTDGASAGYMKFGIYRTPIDLNKDTRTAVRYANMEVSTSSLLPRVNNPRSLD